MQIALVAGGASVANILTCEFPNNPIGGLDELKHAVVNLLVFFKKLQPLGKFPLRRNLAAVSRQPRFVSIARQLIDAIGVRLRRVMLPEFHVGVRPTSELIEV